MSLDDQQDDDEPERICPVTGTYCSGLFCDDYGCAKEAGIWDDESNDGSVI